MRWAAGRTMRDDFWLMARNGMGWIGGLLIGSVGGLVSDEKDELHVMWRELQFDEEIYLEIFGMFELFIAYLRVLALHVWCWDQAMM